MRPRKLFLLFLAMAWLLPAPSAEAKTINLHDDFPDTQGDNGFYAYSYNASRSPQYVLLEDAGAYYFYSSTHAFFAPFVRRRDDVPVVYFHPSAINQIGYLEDAVLGWVVPEDNTYTISGRFYDPQVTGGDGVYVYIRQNGTLLWEYILGIGGSIDFSLPDIALNAGDYLYFGVNARSNDFVDSTYLQGEIAYTPVPLPGAVWLLGSGLMGLGAWRRFRG